VNSKSKISLLPIFLIVAVDILGLTLVLPILPFYAEHYGASPQAVGFLVTIYALCQLVSGPILGRLSDRTGRKPMLIVSQLGTCLGFILLARSHSLGMIFLSRFIDGITAGNLPIAQAYISDVTEPQDRGKAFGIIGIAFGVGFFIGPGISGYLSQFGYAAPAWAASLLSLISVFCTYFLLPAHVNHESPHAVTDISNSPFNLHLYKKYFANAALGRLLLLYFVFSFSFGNFMSGFALFAERRFLSNGHPLGAREVGYFYTYLGLLAIVSQGYMLPRLLKRFGEEKLVVAGFLTQALGYAAMVLVYQMPVLLVTTLLNSFGSGVLRPALASLISQRAGRHEQGAVMGISQSLISVGQILAPILAGFLIGRHWLNVWVLSTAFFSFCGFWLAIRPVKENA